MRQSIRVLKICFFLLGLVGCNNQSANSTQDNSTLSKPGDQKTVFFRWLDAGAVKVREGKDPNREIYAAIKRFVSDDQAVLRTRLSPRRHYSSSRTVWADGEFPAGWIEYMEACVRLRYNPGEELEFARALVVMNSYTRPTYSLQSFDYVAVGKALAAIEQEERHRLHEFFRNRGTVSDSDGKLVAPTQAEMTPPVSALVLLQQRTGFEAARFNNVLIPVIVSIQGLKNETTGYYTWHANGVESVGDEPENVCDGIGP
ncbi:MAG: hypothetical protein MUF76_10055 [Hydrogenophaga sp.]|nr:hypothetical protein [Hydrogenophaga sp.]